MLGPMMCIHGCLMTVIAVVGFAKVTPLYPLTGDGIVLQASEQTVVKPSEGVIDMIGPVTLTQKIFNVISEQGVRINIERHQQVTLKGHVFMQYMNDQFAAESGVYHPKIKPSD